MVEPTNQTTLHHFIAKCLSKLNSLYLVIHVVGSAFKLLKKTIAVATVIKCFPISFYYLFPLLNHRYNNTRFVLKILILFSL